MKIVELQIENIRGIRSLHVKPGSRNFVIWGPNGSGKSAVADAIDFLLTGRVSRLSGKGTGGITLKKHGPHIDCSPKDAFVFAKLEISGSQNLIELRRCMAQPEVLECDEAFKPVLEPILNIVRRGQHILSRREILRYIAAESSTRAQDIQDLLDISDIENIRKVLVKVRNIADKEVEITKRNVDSAQGAISATTQMPSFDVERVLEIINRSREIFGGDRITELDSSKLKMGISLPTSQAGEQAVNVTLLERDIQNLSNLSIEDRKRILAQQDSKLRELLSAIQSDSELLQSLSRMQLIELGISLIDDTGSCPLCETDWPSGKLFEHLNKRLSQAQLASSYQNDINELTNYFKKQINITLPSLDKLIAALETAKFENLLPPIVSWQSSLQVFNIAISDPLSKYPDEKIAQDQVPFLFAPNNVVPLLEDILARMREKYPEASPERTAWDLLTRLEENIKSLEKAQNSYTKALLVQGKAVAMAEVFLSARDEILEGLYDEISGRFSELYKALHGPDEESFGAEIQPDRAGLTFEVEFYGRGKYPPHALHSEGHQDSMGLCLFLALSEKLSQGIMNLTILDDVVMSVDASHRRNVCKLLSKYFPDKQFIITTHDKTWANQLKGEKVVQSAGIVEFYDWTIDAGPRVNYQTDMWEKINDYLTRNDVPSAAALLRRGMEEFFALVCDALEADVKYRLDGRNDLGDFLPSGMGRYRSLLKMAKASAQSWSNKEQFERLNEIDSTISQIYNRTYAEQWAVNANVHFNNWANFSKEDFTPVVEAFVDLQGVFICHDCGSMLGISKKGMIPVNARCNCGAYNWNLVSKKK